MSNINAKFELEGKIDKQIAGVSSLRSAGEMDLAFCGYEGKTGIEAISKSSAGITLCKKSLLGLISANKDCLLIFVDNPRLVFVQFVNRATAGAKKSRISPTARISATAVLGANCQIGDFVTIGDGCIIGSNTVIDNRVSIEHAVIEDNCIIQSGVSIGLDGFAYERHPDGGLERFPHLGGVLIGPGVEICANCSIARGSLQDTVIGRNTKLDALVHIAHNVSLGEKCQLAAGTIIGGSAKLGNSCWTGLNSTVKNQVSVGNNVLIAAGACVIADVADQDVVAGVPAKSIKDKVKTDELFIMTGRHRP